MAIKLIAIDMDGTLLNEKRQISVANQQAIHKALKAGVIVTIATGRMFSSVQHFAQELGMDVPLIVYNGALIEEALSRKRLYASPLPLESANKVFTFCRENNYYVQAYVNDELWVYEDCEFSRMYTDFAGVDFHVKGEELYHLPEDPHKLLMLTAKGEWESAQRRLQSYVGDAVLISNSLPDFLEIVSPQTSKWNAIMFLARKYGFSREEIMCIGDSNNDYDMVANAGIGVAMGNANEVLKGVAKIITGTNSNDGVAMVINGILTQQLPE